MKELAKHIQRRNYERIFIRAIMARCATQKGMKKFVVPTPVGLFVPRPLKWELRTDFREKHPIKGKIAIDHCQRPK
jgi:hypothetical protein